VTKTEADAVVEVTPRRLANQASGSRPLAAVQGMERVATEAPSQTVSLRSPNGELLPGP